MPISPARVAAFQILKRVETDNGYASDLIGRATQLDSRDAGLTSQIVYGCLRYMAQPSTIWRCATRAYVR